MNKTKQIINNVLNSNGWMFLFFIALALLLCAHFRYEVISDLNNYHYYIAWAFLNNRTFSDIAIGLENTYHNPFTELPAYWLITAFNDKPVVYQLYHSLYWGALAFVYYKFCRLYFGFETIKSKVMVGLGTLFGITGFGFMTQLGTSSNEIPVILGTMVGFYLIYRELFVYKTERLKIYILAGIIMGAALGLKFTSITYCVALGMTLMIFYKFLQTPVKTITVFAISGFAGFCITDGYWAYRLYQEFGNPLFPYLNNIFKSPYYPLESLTYDAFYEKDLKSALLFPFLASFQGEKRITSESEMYDLRLALGYVLLFVYLGTMAWRYFSRQKLNISPKTAFLVVFAIISYVIWLYMFSIIRYAIPIEFIIGILAVAYFAQFRPQKTWSLCVYAVICVGLSVSLLAGLPYKSWGTMRGIKQVINTEPVVLPENSLLIGLSGNVGLAAAEIARKNPSVKIVSETAEFILKDSAFQQEIEKLKTERDFIGYLVYLKTPIIEFDRHTPIGLVANNNREEGWRDIFTNLQFIIKTRLGVDSFYCRTISTYGGFNRAFLCIDKKDKYSVFPKLNEQSRKQSATDFRRSIHQKRPLAF